MGIHGFFKIEIKNNKSKYNGLKYDDLGKEIDLDDLCNQCICIDASLIIHQCMTANSIYLTDDSGNYTTHINIVLNKIRQFRTHNIDQIWVFDSPNGNPFKSKTYTTHNKSNSFKSKCIKDIIYLLRCLGIKYIQAPDNIEADHVCAYLVQSNVCTFALSGDSDILLFGGNLLRIIPANTGSNKKNKTVYKIYRLHKILTVSGLSYNQFIQMCIALGTDFIDKTSRFGVTKAIETARNNSVVLTKQQQEIINYIKLDMLTEMANAIFEIDHTFDFFSSLSFLLSKNFDKERVIKQLNEIKSI